MEHKSMYEANRYGRQRSVLVRSKIVDSESHCDLLDTPTMVLVVKETIPIGPNKVEINDDRQF